MKEKLFGALITICVIGLLVAIGMSSKSFSKPTEVYQVYLNGKKIGLIESEDKLLNLIDNEQTSIKESFKVDKVYPPTGLNIEKVYTYNNKLSNTEDVYNQIKESEPFTISGYVVTINYKNDSTGEEGEEEPTPPLKIYLLNPDLIKTSLHDIAATFIGSDELKDYENGTQVEISETGETITSVFFDETITIKETFISTEQKIFEDGDELTQYLMYGSVGEQPKYTVKVGEDLNKIAENHKLNIAELLIANPKYPSGNALIAPGEVLNVGLINPLVHITYRLTEVEDTTTQYNTEYIDDNTKYNDYQKVQTEGVDGITRLTKDVQYTNGEIKKVNIVKQEVVKSPINKVVIRGTKKYTPWSGGGGTPPTPSGAGKLLWPTNIPYVITTFYEYRWGSFHKGIDISGTGWYSPIYASTDGVVIAANKSCENHGSIKNTCGARMGNYVKIYNEASGLIFTYGHVAQNVKVSVGQHVSQGQVIATMAMSGQSTGVHLHFQIEDQSGQTYNPCKMGLRC